MQNQLEHPMSSNMDAKDFWRERERGRERERDTYIYIYICI